MKSTVAVFFTCMFLTSCFLIENNEVVDLVAKVGNSVLTNDDIPNFTSRENGEDSVAQRKLYIDNWVKEQLLLQKAMENLSEQQASFDKQLENYRNSLLIYTFENLIVNQKLDTAVQESELRNYYNSNSANFKLKENLVKGIFVNTVASAPNKDSLEFWMGRKIIESKENLADYCSQFGLSCNLDTSIWVPLAKIKELMNAKGDKNLNLTLGKNTIQDSTKSLYLKIYEFKNKGQIAPFNWVRNELKSILLNKRKIDLIASVKQEIFESAALKEEYEIYE